jgi:hypothetical protein
MGADGEHRHTSGHWQLALTQSYQPMDPMTQPNEAAPPAIVFAPWKTPVENDELSLVSLSYGGASTILDCHSEGFSLEVPASRSLGAGDLEAVFLSVEKKSVVVFRFERPMAFRVLDEHGLLDIWTASGETPRPAHTSFMVKGHKWQQESELSWFMGGTEFSLMIATDWDCLEVVGPQPTVELRPAIVHLHAGK